MKTFIKLFSTIAIVSALLLSCNSNSGLKKQAEQVNKLTEIVKKAKDINALEDIQEDFTIFLEKVPADIKQLSDEELMKLDGAKEFIEAIEDFEVAFEKASSRVLRSELDELDDLDDLDDEDDEE